MAKTDSLIVVAADFWPMEEAGAEVVGGARPAGAVGIDFGRRK
jgi:hypothetical protein